MNYFWDWAVLIVWCVVIIVFVRAVWRELTRPNPWAAYAQTLHDNEYRWMKRPLDGGELSTEDCESRGDKKL